MRRSTVRQRLTCFTGSYILYKANHLTLPSPSPLHTDLNTNIHVCCDVSLRERVMIKSRVMMVAELDALATHEF